MFIQSKDLISIFATIKYFAYLNKFFTYIFILLVSVSYLLENFEYVIKSCENQPISCLEDFDGKKENSETEEGDKKQAKYNDYDDHFFKNHQLISDAGPLGLSTNREALFFCDGYIEIVYSPPDFL